MFFKIFPEFHWDYQNGLFKKAPTF